MPPVCVDLGYRTNGHLRQLFSDPVIAADLYAVIESKAAISREQRHDRKDGDATASGASSASGSETPALDRFLEALLMDVLGGTAEA